MPRPSSRSNSRSRTPPPRPPPVTHTTAPASVATPATVHQHSTNLGLGFGDALKWGAGTAIGQRAVDAVFGARETKVELHEVKVPPTPCPEYGEKKAAMHDCINRFGNCAEQVKAFEKCIDGKN